MALQTVKFTVAERMKDLEEKAEYFRNLVNTAEIADVQETIKAFDEEWNRERNVLSVAFIGQYNAGKSTTISALTKRKDIAIDADIATSETTEYDWKGIKLIDTPGLWTERKEHDQITKDALRQADLLIFTLTYMLFDEATVEHFKELAFEEGYQNKILLLINKVNDEAGDIDKRIEAYRESIGIALEPHNAREFRQCYVDARDYLEGIREKDQELIGESRFNVFVKTLNRFVEEQGKMGQLETPVQILRSHIDLVLQHLMRARGEIAVYPELLSRITREARNGRHQFREKGRVVLADMVSSVAWQGSLRASGIGAEDSDVSEADCEKAIAKACEKAKQEIAKVIRNSISNLQEEVKEICTGNLANAYFSPALTQDTVSSPDLTDTEGIATRRQQWASLSQIAGYGGVTLSALAQDAGTVGESSLLTASEVVGNVVEYIGSAASVISLCLQIWRILQERRQSESISEAKLEVMDKFNKIGQELKKEFEERLQKFEKQTFDRIADEVENAQNAYQKANATNDETSKALLELREELNALLKADRNAEILD